MSPENTLPEARPRRGVKTKLFGFTLMLLGVLDALLVLRSGQGVSHFYIALIGLGQLIWLIGAIRQRSGKT